MGSMSDWEWQLEPTYDGLLQAIESMNCGVTVENEDGLIFYVNARVLEWTGYHVKELDQKSMRLLVPPELHADLDVERQRALEGDGRTRLSVMRRKDGRTFPVAAAPHAYTRGESGERAILCILTDLGEIQTGRPMGAHDNSLAADLASVALKLQSMSFSASVSGTSVPLDHPVLTDLSDREREVLEHLMQGERVPSIAQALFISQNTVRNHLKAIYRKVDVSSQSELIELVRSLGGGAR
jgi:PAS domain S-box-containing protein